jgi:GNAT superfamily N-acetyltransferase
MTKAPTNSVLVSAKPKDGPVLQGHAERLCCDFTVRPYRCGDFKTLEAIWRAGEIALDETDTPQAFAENQKKRKDSWRIFVADVRITDRLTRRPVGKARLAGGLILTFDGHRAYVYHFVVHPDFRGLGLGRALLETCEQQAALWGARHLRLTARCDAARAVAHQLYESVGWRADKSVWVFRKDLQVTSTKATRRSRVRGSTC